MSKPTSHSPNPAQTPSTPEWLQIVIDKVGKLRFGIVQIVIHDGKVMQIESTERTRFNKPTGDV